MIVALTALLLLPLAALAGPEGNYTLTGTSPGGGGTYAGTVEVQRNGDTYVVLWKIGNETYLGTGLGAADVKGVPTMGPAAANDTALAVGYVSDAIFGQAFYVQQSDGTWKGIWTYGGSSQIGTEVWTPQ